MTIRLIKLGELFIAIDSENKNEQSIRIKLTLILT